MDILITGGTGFIGSALCKQLLSDNHDVVVVTRHPEQVSAPMRGIKSPDDLQSDDYFDVVVNLCGEAIADKRWSEQQKAIITSSRLDITKALLDYFERATSKPKVFISGSAIGYYGIASSNADITESAGGDKSFASQLCQQWEALASQAEQLGIRTCLLRTGIVLGAGGALVKMLPPFKFGLGGKIGSGTQWMPWIHLQDIIGIILLCIDNEAIHGAINATAPQPAMNKDFTLALGKVLHRPTFLPMPAMAIKLLMGQMGEELLLAGKKVVPAKAVAQGYLFEFPDLELALTDIIN